MRLPAALRLGLRGLLGSPRSRLPLLTSPSLQVRSRLSALALDLGVTPLYPPVRLCTGKQPRTPKLCLQPPHPLSTPAREREKSDRAEAFFVSSR